MHFPESAVRITLALHFFLFLLQSPWSPGEKGLICGGIHLAISCTQGISHKQTQKKELQQTSELVGWWNTSCWKTEFWTHQLRQNRKWIGSHDLEIPGWHWITDPGEKRYSDYFGRKILGKIPLSCIGLGKENCTIACHILLFTTKITWSLIFWVFFFLLFLSLFSGLGVYS